MYLMSLCLEVFGFIKQIFLYKINKLKYKTKKCKPRTSKRIQNINTYIIYINVYNNNKKTSICFAKNSQNDKTKNNLNINIILTTQRENFENKRTFCNYKLKLTTQNFDIFFGFVIYNFLE